MPGFIKYAAIVFSACTTQMPTVQIYRGGTVDATTFLQAVGKRYRDACAGRLPGASTRDR